MNNQITFRTRAQASDVAVIREMVVATGVFNAAEIDIAVELIDDRLAKEEKSDYLFLFAQTNGTVTGYTCYGLIPGTNKRYEVYWIAVNPALHGKGTGKALMKETERLISEINGRKVYAETSSRFEYAPTRRFYEACGYAVAATVKDHFDKEDDLVIYVKDLVEE